MNLKILLLPIALIFASCAGSTQPLQVKTFTLRDQTPERGEDPMVHHEKLRRLYGAISMEERRQRLGQYYTLLWNAEAESSKTVIFKYQQGGSGSEIKTIRREIQPGASSGIEEISIIGDDFFDGGRVLTWKAIFLVDGNERESKQSYLWQ